MAKKRTGTAKGQDKLTVLDLINTLEHIEAWTGAVRQALETLPPTLELSLRIPGPVPPPPLARWECYPELRAQSGIWGRPAWLCFQSLDALGSDIRPGDAEATTKRPQKRPTKRPKR